MSVIFLIARKHFVKVGSWRLIFAYIQEKNLSFVQLIVSLLCVVYKSCWHMIRFLLFRELQLIHVNCKLNSHFRRKISHVATCYVFTFKCQLSQTERVLFLKVLHMVSCDCPVRNMQHYWPQFHGYYTVCDNKVYCN